MVSEIVAGTLDFLIVFPTSVLTYDCTQNDELLLKKSLAYICLLCDSAAALSGIHHYTSYYLHAEYAQTKFFVSILTSSYVLSIIKTINLSDILYHFNYDVSMSKTTNILDNMTNLFLLLYIKHFNIFKFNLVLSVIFLIKQRQIVSIGQYLLN